MDVLRGNDGRLLHVETPIPAAVGHLAMPNLPSQEGVPKVHVKRSVLLARLEEARIAPQGLFAGVASNLGEGRIGVHDCPIDASDEHCLFGPLNYGTEPTKFCFRLSPLGGVLDDRKQALLVA